MKALSLRWRWISLAVSLLALAISAPLWLQPLLKYVQVNSDSIQALKTLIELALTISGLVTGWLGISQPAPASPSKTITNNHRVNTGGGSYIEGNAQVAGDYIGGDQDNVSIGDVKDSIVLVGDNLKFTGQFERSVEKPKPNLSGIRKAYLSLMYEKYHVLNLKGMGAGDQIPLRLELLDLYIPLLARYGLPVEDRPGDFQNQNPRPHDKPVPVTTLVSEHSGVILLGDPGSGKSTVLKYLLLQLAKENGEAILGGNFLPALVSLGAYANALEKKDVRLDDFIGEYFHQTFDDLPIAELLQEALANGQAMVLLDGLDEIRNLQLRNTVVDRVTDFYHYHYKKGNKFVITSRIIGYPDLRPVSDALIEATLCNLNDDEIRSFVNRWIIAISRQSQLPGEELPWQEIDHEQKELMGAIEQNPGVRKLAANPLLLTILALTKRRRVTLPGRRVELYDQYVHTLISEWNRTRSLTGRAPGPDLDVLQTLRILAPLALWMHQQKNPEIGLVKREDLRRKLKDMYSQRGDPDPELATNDFLEKMHEETALLQDLGQGELGFTHLTFQEYLAGVAIALQAQGDVKVLTEIIRKYAQMPEWREVLLLAIGYIAIIQQLNRVAEQVITALADVNDCPEVMTLAGEAAADLLSSGIEAATLETCQISLRSVLTGTAAAQLRCHAGQVLARLGDPRREVLTIEDMQFCFVSEGPFLMGDENEKRPPQVCLAAYWISRFPITQAQFNLFVKAGGYHNVVFWKEAQGAGLWTEKGFTGHFEENPRSAPRSYSFQFDLPNHPVVGISWYEALAFSRWLQERAKEANWLLENAEIRLPIEAEWEKAARGGSSVPNSPLIYPLNGLSFSERVEDIENYLPTRIFPWGKDLSDEKANTKETGISASSAVGAFSKGKSPYGCEDMAGCVGEWTFGYQDDDPRNLSCGWDHPGRTGNRVTRGGSWYHSRKIAQCSFRRGYAPASFYDFIGFRVVIKHSNYSQNGRSSSLLQDQSGSGLS